MASRIKKEATDAVSELRDYLQRDMHGLTVLGRIERYVGELRHERTALVNQLDRLRPALNKAEAAKEQLGSQLAECSRKLSHAESRQRQAESDARLMRERIAQLESAIKRDPIDSSNASEGIVHANEWYELLTKVRSRIAKAPKMYASVRANDAKVNERIIVLDLGDFIKKCSVDECVTLGMFTAVCCLANFPVGFVAAKQPDLTANRDRLARFIRWCRQWIETTPKEKWRREVLAAQIVAEDAMFPGSKDIFDA